MPKNETTVAELPVPTVVVPTLSPKKPYRLLVKSNAPFFSCTIAGHAFHQRSEPLVTDPLTKKRDRKPQDGIVEPLSESEVAEITRRLPRTYVRWLSRAGCRAEVFEPTEKVPMNPETDEPVTNYLEMRAVTD